MKTFKYYLVITLLSIIPFIILFATPNLPHTSDGGVHLPRMGAYFKAMTDLHIPVRWAGDLNYGYGLPLFNFMYHTPYLLASAFIAIGIGLVPAFKLILMISFLASGICMFLFASVWTGDAKKALWISIFYVFSPFHLVDTLVRGAIGEIYAYAFFPLVLYAILRRSFIFTAIATLLLVISHNSLSLIFFGVAVLFAITHSPNKKTLITTLGGLAAGLGLAAFYWMPALLEHKYTYGDLFMKDLYRTHFPPIQNFFIPNLLNSESLRTAEVSVQLGLFHTVGIFLTVWLWAKGTLDKRLKPLLVLTILLTTGAFIFMQRISLPVWERISFLRQFQFPWRLLALTGFTTSIMAVSYFSLKLMKKQLAVIVILFLTIVSTAYFWYPTQGFDQVDEKDFWNYELNTTYFGETDVIWSAGPASSYPKERVEVIQGKAAVTGFVKRTQTHEFTVHAESDARLVDHTQYFPGWRVWVDGQKADIEFQDQNWRGLITFAVPQGDHKVKVEFGESKIRLVADGISIFSLVVILGASVFVLKKKRHI